MNSANMIYSLHDLKNADKFSSIVDYPFMEFLWDGSLNPRNKILADKKHRMLIFDDNTSSGWTLWNIRKLAWDIKFFDNIELYPCRVNINYWWYRKQNISENDILSFIGNSWYEAKRSKIYKRERDKNKKLTYKDRIWTIIWNRIYRTT